MSNLDTLFAALHADPFDPMAWAALADAREEAGQSPADIQVAHSAASWLSGHGSTDDARAALATVLADLGRTLEVKLLCSFDLDVQIVEWNKSFGWLVPGPRIVPRFHVEKGRIMHGMAAIPCVACSWGGMPCFWFYQHAEPTTGFRATAHAFKDLFGLDLGIGEPSFLLPVMREVARLQAQPLIAPAQRRKQG